MSNTHLHAGDAAHGHNAIAHVASIKVLVGVFVLLLILTGVTVGAVFVDLGALNIWIAMGIATVKALLVAMFFMHLAYDRPFNGIVFIASLVFAGLFVSVLLLDAREYKPNVDSYRALSPLVPSSSN